MGRLTASANTVARRSLVRRVIAVGWLGAVMASLLSTSASAVHDLGLFELDGNAVQDATLPGDDWETLGLTGGNAGFFTGILPDSDPIPGTQFTGGGSKDDLDIDQWLWKLGEPLDKDDITNAYAAAYTNTVDTGNNDVGDTIVYFGLDRFSTAGDAHVGFWFLQDPTFGTTTIPGGGGFRFSGVHQDNDVLVQANFTNGGVIGTASVFTWQAGVLVPVAVTDADCLTGTLPDDAGCAVVNQSATPAPWPYTPKANEGTPGTFQPSAFFEGGLNLTRLVPGAACFTGFVAETRSSTPFDAVLKDFVTGSFEPCAIDVVKTGDSLSKVGDVANYTVTINNTGDVTLFKDDITDTLLGDITIGGVDQGNANVVTNTCGASLAVGASCTITLARTVLAGDPDPLPNTVSIVYRGLADLSGSTISDTDDHSVNLFQPSVDVEKTGDTLSKVGDAATYTITIDNTSSADSPDLVNGTVVDSLLGNLLDPLNPFVTTSTCTATLATGTSCTINATRTVLAGDPDPLPNTVTVHYNPAGFLNDITDNDSHSVNLFQPSVTVGKTGDTLSKVGDPANYTITVTNTSSADSPSLVNGTIIDTLLGNLLDPLNPFVTTSTCTATLGVGASCTINATRTVLATDPDPLPNTVVVTYNPLNFTNVITAEALHDVNLFQPSVTLNKTGDTLGKVGDPVDYTITVNNTSSADSPALVFNSLTDTLLGNLLTPGNPFVTSSNCGAPLASGASCTITATRTVLAGDADPLPNTVTVHLHPDGFPNDITASDDHSVNLFQPSVTVDKTGDTLSKVTDPVNYTITVTNTSSPDSPALTNGTITDTLLGNLLDPANPYVIDATSDCGTGLAPGASCTINATRTVQAGDPDPLPNTVTVHYNPGGFPNDITASDSHSVNLFQPSVLVDKTGDLAGKIGDPVHYTVTVTNTSSADTPNLIWLSLTDTLVGDLLDAGNVTSTTCGPQLAPGASCTVTYQYVVQNGDPDPLINTAIAHLHPIGFPNDITDSDDHTVNLFAPSISVDKTGDALSKIGDPAAYTVTITNTSEAGSPDLVNPTVVDSLVGDLLDLANPAVTNNTCLAAFADGFAQGETCTIEYTYIVQAGDPDPLVNTVEVHFNPEGFPNDITATATTTTNLFQPSVTVDKTGDTLGKVGDPVDYTVTVTNTSSADSPNLVNGTIVDTVLGNLLDAANPFVTDSDCTATLPTGGTCTIEATRVVQAGDPDPLPNEVTVTYNPQGFPNVITASAQHSVNLFQPGVTVAKVCDTLSKIGDPITCTVTVTNTSSADTPNLVFDSIADTLMGTLLAQFPTSLAPGASASFTYQYTVQAGDPDPLVNTVEVHLHPEPFDNDITATATATINLFQPSVTVDKTGDTLSKVGDPANYTVTVTNTSSADSPNLVFDSLLDTLLGDLLDDANTFVTNNTCGVSLASGASCTVLATRTVQVGDADPLPNTATVHAHPDGFPNDITDSDDHSVNLFQPSVTVDKTGDTLSKVGDPANYTVTVTNTSSADSPNLVFDSLLDTLLGDLLDDANTFVTNNTCGVSLASGASCTVLATRTVQVGDADPLPNTATVHAHPDGFPNDITDSDDHSVNLFQPSVTVDKTGDTLSKVGDPANYTVTVTNTSSADSPNLVFDSLLDTLLGDLLDDANTFVTNNTCGVSLASGASCTVLATRTVQVGDADPLPNTATVHAHPDGFPNDITDSDDHSVNLFQPSVTVDKTGDTLSKVGDPANYTVTVTNTSSADSPALVFDSLLDTLLGDLLDDANTLVTNNTCGVSLASGASCTVLATRTVQVGDADPLPNTATVHAHPDGFPNDITDSDDHSVNLFQPSVVVSKTGDTTGEVGDPANYTITVTNTSSADTPNFVNGTIVDSVLGNLLDPANPFVTSKTCTATLPTGASCVISATRTLLASDPDPLSNIVTVHYNPNGFPNDITNSDTHTVDVIPPVVVAEPPTTVLPPTGGDPWRPLWPGSLLAVAGIGLWLVSRRRRQTA